MKAARVYYNEEWGFTATFSNLIHSLARAKKLGLYPVIEWYSKLYSDNIEENIFNTYFNIKNKPDNLDVSNMVTLSPYVLEEDRHNWRKVLCDAYAIYIEPKRIIIDRVDNIFKNYTDIPLIGVHIRNTDRSVEPAYASPGIHFVVNRLMDVLKQYNGAVGLYIASDNIPDVLFLKHILHENKSNLPDISYIEDPNCVRSPNQISVHGNFDEGLKTATNQEKTLSILTDVYCLARCEKIVKTCSNVTAVAGIISPTTKFIDVSLEHGKVSDEWLL